MTTDRQRLASKHEAEVAQAFCGQATPMSGAGWVSKHDVHTDTELIECKATEAASYSLKLALLEELEKQGFLAGKRPVLSVKMAPVGRRARRFVVLPEDDYLTMRNMAYGDPRLCPETNWCDDHRAFGVHLRASK